MGTAAFSPLGGEVDMSTVEAVCIGTGRFLRAVLVPALTEIGCEVVMAQARGNSFVEHMASRRLGYGARGAGRTYEVDTILQDGQVLTNSYPVAAVGSLGDAAGRAVFMELPKRMKQLRYIGLGLTEAGIAHNGRSIVDLAEFLHGCFAAGLGAGAPICLISTDNMPFNGDAIRQHVGACDFTHVGPNGRERASAGFSAWLEQSVVFHNSMVDRLPRTLTLTLALTLTLTLTLTLPLTLTPTLTLTRWIASPLTARRTPTCHSQSRCRARRASSRDLYIA